MARAGGGGEAKAEVGAGRGMGPSAIVSTMKKDTRLTTLIKVYNLSEE